MDKPKNRLQIMAFRLGLILLGSRTRIWIGFMLVIVTCLFMVFLGYKNTNNGRPLTKKEVRQLMEVEPVRLASMSGPPFDHAKTIMKALDAYMATEGSFPHALNLLVPQYIESIPSPDWGCNVWKYNLDPPGNYYSLSVNYKKDVPIDYLVGPDGVWLYRNGDYADLFGPSSWWW